MGKVYIRARAQKIYIGLIDKDIEAARVYYDNEVPVSERRENFSRHFHAFYSCILTNGGPIR